MENENKSSQGNTQNNGSMGNGNINTEAPRASLGGQPIDSLLSGGPKPSMRPVTEGFTLVNSWPTETDAGSGEKK